MSVNRTEEYMPATDEFSASAINDRPAQSTSTPSAIQSGWDAGEKITTPSQGYAKDFKFTDGGFQVIKFIDTDGIRCLSSTLPQ